MTTEDHLSTTTEDRFDDGGPLVITEAEIARREEGLFSCMAFRTVLHGATRVEVTDEDKDDSWLAYKSWVAAARNAAARCRKEDDARHLELEDFDAAGRAVISAGAARLVAAYGATCPRWCRLELRRAFVISRGPSGKRAALKHGLRGSDSWRTRRSGSDLWRTCGAAAATGIVRGRVATASSRPGRGTSVDARRYDAADSCSSHDVHVDPRTDVTLNLSLTPDDEYKGGELYFPAYRRFDTCHLEIQHRVNHRYGCVVAHSGSAHHAARPLRRGRRSNLILWCQRVGRLDAWRRVPHDVKTRVAEFLRFRDLLSFATTAKAERRAATPTWLAKLEPGLRLAEAPLRVLVAATPSLFASFFSAFRDGPVQPSARPASAEDPQAVSAAAFMGQELRLAAALEETGPRAAEPPAADEDGIAASIARLRAAAAAAFHAIPRNPTTDP